MKNVPAWMQWVVLVTSGCIILTSCGSPTPAYNSPTATAQALRAKQLATQIAIDLRATDAWEEQKVEATADALRASLNENPRWVSSINDAFDQIDNDWPTGSDEDPLATIQWNIMDGKYQWQAQANESFVWWAYPSMQTVTDFHLSVDTRQTSGPPDSEWGLVYRITPDDDYYLFEINGQKEFAVFLHKDETWETLLDWTESAILQDTQANRLAVIGQGPQFLFFINDQFAAQLTDNHLESGKAGILIGLSNAGDQASWEFDNFSLRSPDLQESSQSPVQDK